MGKQKHDIGNRKRRARQRAEADRLTQARYMGRLTSNWDRREKEAGR